MICRSLDYMVVMCLVVTMPQRCTTERLPPPFNLSYVWVDPFSINLTWQAHPFNPNCSLKYLLNGPNKNMVSTPYLSSAVVADFNFDLKYTLNTQISLLPPLLPLCSHYADSEAVSIVIPRQVPLVTDFKFFSYPLCDGQSSQMPFCGKQATWIPANGTSGLQVFYRPCHPSSAKLSACNVSNRGGLRQGCHLAGLEEPRIICILFQGKLDGRAANHTFRKQSNRHFRTLQPNVSITEQGGRLNVSWRHSTVCRKDMWYYTIHYSECDRPAKNVTSPLRAESMLVPFDKTCRYEVRVQPRLDAGCGVALADSSPLLVYNDGATRDHSMIVACVAIPGILSVLVLAVCYYVRRKRNTIFENIPVPPSSLKEMMSSIHQSQLFVPVREEVQVCRVSPAPVELHTLMWKVP